MARNDKADLFNMNRSVTSLAHESRQFRLPTMSPFPKLDQRISRPALLCPPAGALPEMTTDVLDTAAGYAVENVKRDRAERRSQPRLSLGHWIGRIMGCGHRAARP